MPAVVPAVSWYRQWILSGSTDGSADTQRDTSNVGLVVGAGGTLATRSSWAWRQDRGGTMTMSEVKGKPIGTV